MDKFLVRKIKKKDVNQVYEIECNLVGKTDKQAIYKTIESECLNYYVLVIDERVVGYFECKVIPPEAELYSIAIVGEYQGQGLSKILMDKLIEIVKQSGCDTLLLEVNKINIKAINLYKKYNFSVYGERKNYYGDNDAVLMKREIF